MEEVAIFIDGSNFYHGIKENLGEDKNIEFECLQKLLTGSRQLVRTYYYNAPVRKEDDIDLYKGQQRFFEKLHNLPYFTVRLGRLEKRQNGNVVEKGVDIKLAVDMLNFAIRDTYDTAILVAGDGDYAYLVKAVKDLGKHVEVAFFSSKKAKSYHLRKVSDKFIHLNEDYLGKCIF